MAIEQPNTEWTTLIEASDLARQIERSDLITVDCRFSLADPDAGRREFRDSHIPGAQYAHLDEDLTGLITPGQTGRHPLPTVSDFVQTLERLGISNRSQVIAYDASGGAFSSRFWWMLNWLGHSTVAVLNGGWQAWREGGFPESSRVSNTNPGSFEPSIQPKLLISASDVLATLSREDWLLLDARDPTRYRGEEEPLDPVAGHIPGAVSAPYKKNLGNDGRFLSREALAARYNAIIGSNQPEHIVAYCGSGVTGAHNVLAMKHSGLDMPGLYAGSWSEWIADASRPVALGDESINS